MPTYTLVNKNKKGEGVTVIAADRAIAFEKLLKYLGWVIKPQVYNKRAIPSVTAITLNREEMQDAQVVG